MRFSRTWNFAGSAVSKRYTVCGCGFLQMRLMGVSDTEGECRPCSDDRWEQDRLNRIFEPVGCICQHCGTEHMSFEVPAPFGGMGAAYCVDCIGPYTTPVVDEIAHYEEVDG